jgi:arginase family enzyme
LGIARTSFARTSRARTAQHPCPDRARGARAQRRQRGGRRAARLAERPAWLHLDLDVLDERALPAVSYPQPLELDWELVALVRPLLAEANLLGVSVPDFNPDRDADGTHAAGSGAALESLCGRQLH